MKNIRLTSEHLLFALALLLGLVLRLLNLGQPPLSDGEAGWALQALSVARNQNLVIGSQTGYVMLTGLMFWLFNSSNTLARLLPALAGSALILSPLFFRHRLGRSAALILAFGLALDPGLVAVSRQAGSQILAATFVVFAAGFAYRRSPRLAGVFAALSLLSGTAVWMGLLGLGLTLIIMRRQKINPLDISKSFTETEPFPWRPFLKQAFIALAITMFLVGSLFFRYPQGLSAWLLSIPEFLNGWISPSGVPALRLTASLLIYQPLAVVYAFICVGHLLRKNQTHLEPVMVKGLALWFVFSLFLAFINIGRSMGDLVWVLLPLWTIASLELAYLFIPGESQSISWGQAALTFILSCIIWLLLASLARAGGILIDWRLIAQLAGAMSLLVIAAYLISLGWKWQVTRPGLAWGSAAFLSLYMLSATWGVSQYSAGGKKFIRQELWYPAPLTGHADIFISALKDLSVRNTKHDDTIDVRLAVDAPSMHWVLRDFKNVEIVSSQTPVRDLENLPPEALPSIIITYSLDSDLNLSAAYRGQDFAWQVHPAWDGSLPPSFLSWLVYREVPLESYQVILWARADIFPGGMLVPEDASSINP